MAPWLEQNSPMDEFVPLDRLDEKRYGLVICYPRCEPAEMKGRLMEMRELGIEALSFSGEKAVGNLQVLGKGCVGIVVLARVATGWVALKIRRTDADRSGMGHEAEMLRFANSVGVGPKLIGCSENLLVMEFIDGVLLPRWVEEIGKEECNWARVRRILRETLEQCWRLDEAGLDHGELSQASKHVIVDADERPQLLDFETASTTRKVSNVTSVCQYLFLSGRTAEQISRGLCLTDRNGLIHVLKRYKMKRCRENFEEILRTSRLRAR